MYSRNTWEKKEYSVPPGYDGSRFRRRRRNDGGHPQHDEIILVPDSGFAPVSHTTPEESSGELSVGGIPTRHGIRESRKNSTTVEDVVEAEEISNDTTPLPDETKPKEKLTGILEKLGFTGGMSSDELLICAVIFLIASDTAEDGRSIGDVLLILALLLGIR